MAQNNVADLIFERWEAALKSKDRSKNAMPGNFDELFTDLKTAGIPFQDAHDMLPRAIKAHLPNKAIRKNIWNKNKYLQNTFSSPEEFAKEWDDTIKSSATDAFFTSYPLKLNDDDDGEPKVFGNMSAKEYKLQRRHADAYPTLNTDDLVKQMKERKSLLGDLSNVLGDKDDNK